MREGGREEEGGKGREEGGGTGRDGETQVRVFTRTDPPCNRARVCWSCSDAISISLDLKKLLIDMEREDVHRKEVSARANSTRPSLPCACAHVVAYGACRLAHLRLAFPHPRRDSPT